MVNAFDVYRVGPPIKRAVSSPPRRQPRARAEFVKRVEKKIRSAEIMYRETKRSEIQRSGDPKAGGDPYFLGLVAGLKEALIEFKLYGPTAGR